MRNLTTEEIDSILTRYPKAKANAVSNVLRDLHNKDPYQRTLNVHQDAKSYGWNTATVNAILRGIDIATE
jgi:hypothetical protein